MPNEVILDDAELEGFSAPAKQRLRQASLDHLQDLIAECYRLEASSNSGGGATEITQAMVTDAVVFRRRERLVKKGRWWRIPLKIFSSILPLLVGFFFNSQSVTQGNNLVLFVILVAITVAVVTASVITDV